MSELEIVSTIVSVVSGICAFFVWRIWPGNDPNQTPAIIAVLKTIVGAVFLVSGLLVFVLEIMGVLF